MCPVPPSRKTLAVNRRARHEYFIEDRIEAGIVLTGTEVKSARGGNIQLRDGHVEVRGNEAWLVSIHISPYSHGTDANHDPERKRKLLLTSREIERLAMTIQRTGMTVIPLSVYIKGHLIKVELGVARGKKLHDKRQTAKNKIMQREAEEAIGRRGR